MTTRTLTIAPVRKSIRVDTGHLPRRPVGAARPPHPRLPPHVRLGPPVRVGARGIVAPLVALVVVAFGIDKVRNTPDDEVIQVVLALRQDRDVERHVRPETERRPPIRAIDVGKHPRLQ